MAVIDDLQAAVGGIRTAATGIGEKIDAALARLADNPTAEAVDAAVADLNAVKETLGGFGTSIDSIDPSVEGGVIPPGTEITAPEPD